MDKTNFKIDKVLSILACLIVFISTAHADLDKKISEYVSGLIPGDGITETSIELNNADTDNINFSILGVRNLDLQSDSNFFTQFSLRNEEKNNHARMTGNLGLGYRALSSDGAFMFGANSFLDGDIFEGHKRLGFGLEAKGQLVDFSSNYYQGITRMEIVEGTEEKILSGWDYNFTTQIPHHPWARVNLQGYKWGAEKGVLDQRGMVYATELDLSPTTQFVFSLDNSSVASVDDVYKMELNFVYPPRENIATAQDGKSDQAFEKSNMEDKLTAKIRRNNNLAVEIQGQVIITSK